MLAYVFAAFLLGLITGVVIGRLRNKSELRLYKAFVEDRLSREASLAAIALKPKRESSNSDAPHPRLVTSW
jgi:hypothetical protein